MNKGIIDISNKSTRVIGTLTDQNISISTMESCTGGLLASCITNVSGASAIFKGGFVTYSNEAKIMQGVPEETINQYGVYSAETAQAMAKATAEAYNSLIGIGITGSLGRVDPNNADSQVGKVYVSIYMDGKYTGELLTIPEEITERSQMKAYVVDCVLDMLDGLSL